MKDCDKASMKHTDHQFNDRCQVVVRTYSVCNVPIRLIRVVERASMSAFVYDGFALEELEEMLGLLALRYTDLRRGGKGVCEESKRECVRRGRE